MRQEKDKKTAYIIDPWTITESHLERELVPRSESVFTVGNGRIGVRGSFSEDRNVYSPGTFINGFYEIVPICYGEWAYGFPRSKQQIVPVPSAVELDFLINNELFDPLMGTLLSYTRTLDMRNGLLRRFIRWQSPKGIEIEVETTRLAPFVQKPFLLFQLSLRCRQSDIPLEIRSSVNSAVSSHQTNPFDPRIGPQISPESIIPGIAEWRDHSGVLSFSTKNSKKIVACAVRNRVNHHRKYEDHFSENPVSITHTIRTSLQSDNLFTITKYASYAIGEMDESGAEEVADRAVSDGDTFARKTFEHYKDEQSDYLRRFWEGVGIGIKGEAALQQGMRFNIFHLLQAAGTDGETGIPAKGLTGEGYEGHSFWDTEIYILPFFSYTFPEIAKKIIDYRYSTLPKAEKRAAELSHRGALYAWRTINGDECSPYFPAGTAQYHINADIMFAVRTYLKTTDDRDYLWEKAAEMVFKTAIFYLDLGSFIEGKGFCINGVTGPDEYTAMVNNNTYTNLMVQEHLRYAARTAKELQESDSVRFEELTRRCDITNVDIELWQKAAEAMYLPYDKERGMYGQDDSFFFKPKWDFQSTPTHKFPLLLHYHPLNIYRHQVLKQPDTVLAGVLLPKAFSAAERRRHFHYYDPLTTGDSSLSPCVQSIAAADIGFIEQAYEYFMQTARMDLDDINRNTKNGLHLASMGGTWVSLFFGFLGFRLIDGVPHFSPCLPKQWTELTFRITVRGSLLELILDHCIAHYSLIDGPEIMLFHKNRQIDLSRDNPTSLSMKPELEAVILDLDGVITDTAEYHYTAWKRLADELQLPFNREFNHNLRGIGRIESLQKIVEQTSRSFSDEEIYQYAQRKNGYYRELIDTITPDELLPGIGKLLSDLQANGIKVAIASASKNALKVIHNLGIENSLDYIADAASIAVGKPDPEIFLTCAEQLTVPFTHCAGVEDAEAGIEAINNAGMFSIGIGDYLQAPDWKLSSTEQLTFTALKDNFTRFWNG